MIENVRIGFMAGRGISVPEIAAQLDLSPGKVRAVLGAARIDPSPIHGPSVHIIVPIAAFVPEIDAVGRRRKMSREEIACEILRVTFAGGEHAIEDIIERGELG